LAPPLVAVYTNEVNWVNSSQLPSHNERSINAVVVVVVVVVVYYDKALKHDGQLYVYKINSTH